MMARALAEHHLQIVCMACRQVRNLARYARGGYNPDTRVDVIISVMVRITPHICLAPVLAAAALRTPPCAIALCQLLRSACVPGLLAIVAEQRQTQRIVAWSSWLCRVVMIYSCLCRSYVIDNKRLFRPCIASMCACSSGRMRPARLRTGWTLLMRSRRSTLCAASSCWASPRHASTPCTPPRDTPRCFQSLQLRFCTPLRGTPRCLLGTSARWTVQHLCGVVSVCVKHLTTARVTAGFSRHDVTRRVNGDALQRPQAYRNRNRMMREWVANQTSGAHYIDFDALAFAPNLPVGTLTSWSLAQCNSGTIIPAVGLSSSSLIATGPSLLPPGSMCGRQQALCVPPAVGVWRAAGRRQLLPGAAPGCELHVPSRRTSECRCTANSLTLQFCGVFRLKVLQEQAASSSPLPEWSVACLS